MDVFKYPKCLDTETVQEQFATRPTRRPGGSRGSIILPILERERSHDGLIELKSVFLK